MKDEIRTGNRKEYYREQIGKIINKIDSEYWLDYICKLAFLVYFSKTEEGRKIMRYIEER